MQFSAVPLNLMGLKTQRKAAYLITGKWGILAEQEARKFGNTTILLDGKPGGYRFIPEWDSNSMDEQFSYVHLTSNNTLYGTQWNKFPKTGSVPLVADATSEMLSRPFDFQHLELVYAGMQKNLGPPGLCLVLIHEDLLGQALDETPKLLDYKLAASQNSLVNTTNTFSLYVFKLVLEWVESEGGVYEMQRRAEERSSLIYSVLDHTEFFEAISHQGSRSTMNITFNLPDQSLLQHFLDDAQHAGLYALKGHNEVGGVRASMYNALPLEAARELAAFMADFEKRFG